MISGERGCFLCQEWDQVDRAAVQVDLVDLAVDLTEDHADCASVGSIASDPEFCADEVANTTQDQTTETEKTNRIDETKNETTEPKNNKETNILPIILAITGGLLFIAIIIAVIALISKSKKTTNLNPTYPIAQDENTTYDNQNQQNPGQ